MTVRREQFVLVLDGISADRAGASVRCTFLGVHPRIATPFPGDTPPLLDLARISEVPGPGSHQLAAWLEDDSAITRARPTGNAGSRHGELRREQENLVLIGMPGSGKTTVGQRAARLMDREFIDCDERYLAEYGILPEEELLQNGEPYFRQRETALLQKLSLQNGCVIAAGGGAVLRAENVGSEIADRFLHSSAPHEYWKEEIEDVYTVREISAKESDEEKPAAKKSIDDLKRLFGDL